MGLKVEMTGLRDIHPATTGSNAGADRAHHRQTYLGKDSLYCAASRPVAALEPPHGTLAAGERAAARSQERATADSWLHAISYLTLALPAAVLSAAAATAEGSAKASSALPVGPYAPPVGRCS